jgi:hypothetical protein
MIGILEAHQARRASAPRRAQRRLADR